MFKNRISTDTERRREKKQRTKRPDLGEGGKRVYVLPYMVVTFPTCHLERLPLKTLAELNTAPHSNKEKSMDKNGIGKKRREHCIKIELVPNTKGRRRSSQKKTPILLERRGEKSVLTI